MTARSLQLIPWYHMQRTTYPEEQFHNSAGLTEDGESLEKQGICCPDKTDRSAVVAAEFPRIAYHPLICSSLNTENASAQLSPCHIPALDLECLQPERKLHQGTQSNLVLGQSCSATAHFSTNAGSMWAPASCKEQLHNRVGAAKTGNSLQLGRTMGTYTWGCDSPAIGTYIDRASDPWLPIVPNWFRGLFPLGKWTHCGERKNTHLEERHSPWSDPQGLCSSTWLDSKQKRISFTIFPARDLSQI